MGDLGAGFLLIIIALAIYFVPTFVAMARDHRDTGLIFAVNLLLGWTFLGWAAGLIWAVVPKDRVASASPQNLVAEPIGSSDPIADLERYAALMEKGVITQDEFNAAKARILAKG